MNEIQPSEEGGLDESEGDFQPLGAMNIYYMFSLFMTGS